MSLLVTGGAGFIGSNFVREWFRKKTEEIVTLDKCTYAGNSINLDGVGDKGKHILVKGDISNCELVSALFNRVRPRAIINFAAESHVDRSIIDHEAFVQTNVVGTSRLLKASLEYWDRLDDNEKEDFRFLHISTDEVYGDLEPDGMPFNEKNSYRPNNPYSASKASSDHFVRAYFATYGLPIIVTNCSNNYGPYQYPEKLIPLIIRNCLEQKELPIYGDGLQVRDWLYVKDHCRALTYVLEKGRLGETYNIGGNSERTNLEVIHTICDIVEKKHPGKIPCRKLIAHIEDRLGHDRRYAIDNSKICRDLGWNPKESLESGLEKTVDWYLANFPWVKKVTGKTYQRWMKLQYT